MKYNLDAMKFDPNATNIASMFDWDETPEGWDYWCDVNTSIISFGFTPPCAQIKLDTMRKQWEEENVKEPKQYIALFLDGEYIGPSTKEDIEKSWNCDAIGIESIWEVSKPVKFRTTLEIEE